MNRPMYHYPQYLSLDDGAIKRFISKYPLALVTTFVGLKWASSHIPLTWSEKHHALVGHADVANPQFIGVESCPAQIIFSGPNCFIPSSAYLNKHLPTWNYVAVHAIGTISVKRTSEDAIDKIMELVGQMSNSRVPTTISRDDPRLISLSKSVVGLEITVESFEGRFKLSQDKNAEDMQAAIYHFVREHSVSLTTTELCTYAESTARVIKPHE